MSECGYGCGQEAKHQFKNGKWCCSKNWQSCPVSRKLYSLAAKKVQNKIEVREKKSKSVKDSWKDPQKRKNHIKALNRPEVIEKLSVAAKLTQNTLEVKEKKIQTFLERYSVRYVGQLKKVREESKQRLLCWQADYMNLFPRDHNKLKKLYEATGQRMLGEGNPLWNSNREEVFAPYTEKFFDLNYRNQIKQEQNYIDPITENVLREAQLHHIDYNKQNDARENLIWLNLSTHVKTNGSRKNREKWQNILQKINEGIVNNFSER